jgi:uncharacterized protein (UPF0332 family)
VRLLCRVSRGRSVHYRADRQDRQKPLGVRSEFGRLAKDTPALDKTFSTFLAKAYSYKEIGDYRVDQGAIVTDAEAEDAIEAATRFIERVTRLLTSQ